ILFIEDALDAAELVHASDELVSRQEPAVGPPFRLGTSRNPPHGSTARSAQEGCDSGKRGKNPGSPPNSSLDNQLALVWRVFRLDEKRVEHGVCWSPMFGRRSATSVRRSMRTWASVSIACSRWQAPR